MMIYREELKNETKKAPSHRQDADEKSAFANHRN